MKSPEFRETNDELLMDPRERTKRMIMRKYGEGIVDTDHDEIISDAFEYLTSEIEHYREEMRIHGASRGPAFAIVNLHNVMQKAREGEAEILIKTIGGISTGLIGSNEEQERTYGTALQNLANSYYFG